MAKNEQKIHFKLDSDFDGKGFQQANAEISKTAKQTAKTADGVTKLADAASMLPGKFGAMASSLTGIAGTIKNILSGIGNLGVFGAVAAGVGSLVAGIKLGMDFAERRVKEAKERMARHAEAMKAAITSRLNWLRNKIDDDLSHVRDGVSKAISSFDTLIGRINKLNNSKATIKIAEERNRAATRQLDKTATLIDVKDDDERAMLKARLEEQEAEEERAEIIR